jgi:TonB family protein
VRSPPLSTELVELNLLRPWREPVTPRRIAQDVFGSLFIHVLFFAFIVLTPDTILFTNSPEIRPDFRKAVTLLAPPPSELTQKAPNQGKVLKQLDVRSAVQAQPAQAPHIRQFSPPPGPPARGPEPLTLEASEVETPQIQTGPITAQLPSLGGGIAGLNPSQSLPGPPPRPAPVAAPKPPQAPRQPDPVREALRSGGGGVTVGDISEDSPRVPGVTPSPCNDCSALQLLSDPTNVDFKPYLLQVLAMVKRNWMSVIPASARLGHRGIVVVRFAIDRKGTVPQLEFSTPSGTDFDRAAVAGISASVPFPPLPAEYRGDQIRLQMAFAYNMVAPH